MGLADPIRTGDIARQERLDDGLPQSLEEYIDEQGISYFKIKVNGDLEGDLERLRRIAELLDRTEVPYRVSLDGNEQYREMETFLELMGRMQEERVLDRFYSSIIYIEQPLDRAAALDPALAAGIRSVSARKPMVIDESDEDLGVFKAAVDLGYLGVSSKNCKGVLKALTNQALARHLGEDYFLTGEDLMNLPIVALHQDLVHPGSTWNPPRRAATGTTTCADWITSPLPNAGAAGSGTRGCTASGEIPWSWTSGAAVSSWGPCNCPAWGWGWRPTWIPWCRWRNGSSPLWSS